MALFAEKYMDRPFHAFLPIDLIPDLAKIEAGKHRFAAAENNGHNSAADSKTQISEFCISAAAAGSAPDV
jgi:hypothetical protein